MGKDVDGWIGVDLDGTLAKYDGWHGIEHIGMPIRPMMERVRTWLAMGIQVKIFTARVEHGPGVSAPGKVIKMGSLYEPIAYLQSKAGL